MKHVLSNKKAVCGLAILGFFVMAALFGPLFADDAAALVARPHSPPSSEHWLGTTGQGQDVLAQTIAGAGPTLLIGFGVGLVVTLIGAAVGVAAGYFGGWVDDVLSLAVNLFLVIPGLPLMVIVAAYLPTGPATMAAVLTLTGWAWSARVLRAQTLTVRQRDFVAAAVVGGESTLRILFVEILPNMMPVLASGFIGATVYAIGAQVGLEFLGLGDVSTVTWGTNLYWASNDAALLTGSYWTYVPTGLCVALVGFALVLVSFAVDELSNPRLSSTSALRAYVRRQGLAHGLSTPVSRQHG